MTVIDASTARFTSTHRAYAKARRTASTTAIVALGVASAIAVMLVADIRGTGAAGLAAVTIAALSIGCFSAAVLCNLSLLGHRAQPIGIVGAAIALAAAAHTLWMTWAFFNAPQVFAEQWGLQWAGMVTTFAFAVVSVLLHAAATVATALDTDRSPTGSRPA